MWYQPQFHQYLTHQIFLNADLSMLSLVENLGHTLSAMYVNVKLIGCDIYYITCSSTSYIK